MAEADLDRVEIESYRGIERLAIDLDELTTVIGEPDCGKSSLLRAVATVLDPAAGDELPRFSESDFHRAPRPRARRSSQLTITLVFGETRLRVRSRRARDGKTQTRVEVVDEGGRSIRGVDGAEQLRLLRRRHPAIIVGRPRAAMGRASGGARSRGPSGGPRAAPSAGPRAGPSSHLRETLRAAARTGAPVTWDQLLDLRDELIEGAGVIADQLQPEPQRARSVREMADTPRPLTTDLKDALASDAGRQRRVGALWLIMSILEAIPEAGLPEDADPILLFDDIEANLHPTWLAALCSVAINLPFQKVIATHSSEVLSWMPLSSLRRLTRSGHGVRARSVRRETYSDDELRRLTFHLRLNRGSSFFARCWILVEGETEAWLIPEFGRLAGVEFPVEGIRCIEFAQSGVGPLVKAADDLGIAWFLLSDGDQAGKGYAKIARDRLPVPGRDRVIVLPSRDIEHYLYRSGYSGVIRKAAGRTATRSAGKLIAAAVKNVSKPGLALEILAEADRRGPEGVPPVIAQLVEAARQLAVGQEPPQAP